MVAFQGRLAARASVVGRIWRAGEFLQGLAVAVRVTSGTSYLFGGLFKLCISKKVCSVEKEDGRWKI